MPDVSPKHAVRRDAAPPDAGRLTAVHFDNAPHARAPANLWVGNMTDRIRDFLRARRDMGQDEGPVMVLDLEVVRDNYAKFARALPDTRVF